MAFSKTEGRILTMGFANIGVYSWHIKQPSDSAIDPFNNIGVDWEGRIGSGTLGAYLRGQTIWDLGTLSIACATPSTLTGLLSTLVSGPTAGRAAPRL